MESVFNWWSWFQKFLSWRIIHKFSSFVSIDVNFVVLFIVYNSYSELYVKQLNTLRQWSQFLMHLTVPYSPLQVPWRWTCVLWRSYQPSFYTKDGIVLWLLLSEVYSIIFLFVFFMWNFVSKSILIHDVNDEGSVFYESRMRGDPWERRTIRSKSFYSLLEREDHERKMTTHRSFRCYLFYLLI